MKFYKKKRFWVSLATVGVAFATGQASPDTVAAAGSLLGAIFGG